MMKRILSLSLLLVLVCFAFVGCGKSELDKSKDYVENNQLVNNNPKLTLSFCLVTDTKLNVAALSTMENQFNALLEISHNTHLDFINLTTAEYASALEAKLAAVEAARDADDGSDSDDILLGNTFPEVKDTQFDILLITSFDMLTDLIDDGRLYELTDFLASTKFRNIKNYITESFLTEAKLDGRSFAIPNCTLMGKYEYLLVDKNAAAKYGYFSDRDFTDWESTAELREAIKAEGTYTFADPYEVGAPVRLVKGNYELRESFGSGSYWYIEKNPVGNRSDIFDSMFAISAYSIDPDRAMQVLYAINSIPEYRTMLQYGVPNATYSLKDGVVELPANAPYAYSVSADYTGNFFALYPCKDRGQTAKLMAGWKLQNDALTFVDDLPEYTPPAAK
jgi:hypothetical protein